MLRTTLPSELYEETTGIGILYCRGRSCPVVIVRQRPSGREKELYLSFAIYKVDFDCNIKRLTRTQSHGEERDNLMDADKPIENRNV